MTDILYLRGFFAVFCFSLRGFSEYIRLSKSTVHFNSRNSRRYIYISFTYITIPEKKIDITKIILSTNNRTILYSSISLPQEYQYLNQI